MGGRRRRRGRGTKTKEGVIEMNGGGKQNKTSKHNNKRPESNTTKTMSVHVRRVRKKRKITTTKSKQ